jgi:predicted transcriptional regulator
MTVKELAEKYSFEILSMPDPEREVNGGYIGDLLSWVMGRAEASNLWLTIMTNMNIAAVAQLSDVSAVLVCEGARPDDSVIHTADEKGVNILLTNDTAYNTAVRISSDI